MERISSFKISITVGAESFFSVTMPGTAGYVLSMFEQEQSLFMIMCTFVQLKCCLKWYLDVLSSEGAFGLALYHSCSLKLLVVELLV